MDAGLGLALFVLVGAPLAVAGLVTAVGRSHARLAAEIDRAWARYAVVAGLEITATHPALGARGERRSRAIEITHHARRLRTQTTWEAEVRVATGPRAASITVRPRRRGDGATGHAAFHDLFEVDGSAEVPAAARAALLAAHRVRPWPRVEGGLVVARFRGRTTYGVAWPEEVEAVTEALVAVAEALDA